MATIVKKISKRTGNISFRVKVRMKGHRPQSKTFKRRTDALRWAAQTESNMRDGTYIKTSEARKHTVSETIDRYINTILASSQKRKKDVGSKLEFWKKRIGRLTLADLNKPHIINCRYELENGTKKGGKQRAAATVNRYLNALSHVFTIAMNEWEWLENHPMQKISKLKEPRGRVRFLNDDERKRLLYAAESSSCPHLKLIIILALSTGARFSEIMHLKWNDVDFERQIITLHYTKNGERRTLHISKNVLPLLQNQHEKYKNIADYVFPAPQDNKPYKIRAAWNRVVTKAKLEDFRFHDLRHSAASYLAMNGATSSEIAEVLGHKTLSMVRRYAHLSESHTASVVERMNSKIFG